MVGKLSHIQRTEVLLFTMCSVFIRLVFSTDSNEILPAKPPKAESKPAAFLQSMEHFGTFGDFSHLLIIIIIFFFICISHYIDKRIAAGGSCMMCVCVCVCVCVVASPPFSGNGVLHWRADSFPVFTRGLEYKDNSLYVQQDGYYYIFSKISHMENCNFFKHQVMQCTERYNFKAIELMQSSRGNSYLGGIFHLLKGDSVFVKVSNSSQVHGEAYENFFGAFMV
uniref:THD domain-containing protein n=1 Tax=Cyprinus carpio TaxID=7962 RepID=A0A8C2GAA0_CYPCA